VISCSRDPRHLHSFPTRRSSDLSAAPSPPPAPSAPASDEAPGAHPGGIVVQAIDDEADAFPDELAAPEPPAISEHDHDDDPDARSEEHTSELQSRENLVCRLLLE